MDEQLEQQAGRGEGEILPEAEGSPTCAPAGAMQASNRAEPGSWRVASEEAAEEAAASEAEMNIEGSPEETENVSNGELSDSEKPMPSPGGEGGSPTGLTDEVIPPAGDTPQRDHYAEWQELAEAHPEVIGKELPEDIYQACMQSELPPLRVYESMMLQKQSEQIAALQNEIATLRQNAENTARAPVSAAGGGPDNEPEDLFLKGFNSY